MDIFEYNEVRWPTRALQQEEEEQAVGTAEQHLHPPAIEWSSGAAPVEKPVLLVVAMSAASCALLKSCLAAAGAQAVGTIRSHSSSSSSSTAQTSDEASSLHSSAAAAAESSASVYSTELGAARVLVCCCSKPVAAEGAPAWARGLLQQLQPQRLLLVGSMQAEQYRGEADPSQEFLAFLLQSSSARQPAGAAAAPYLPSGSVVSGLPAALISQAELRGIPAELFVVVEAVPALVPATLHELSQLIDTALKRVPGRAADGGSALLRLQQEDVVGAARAQLQQGSCRPTSVYS